MAIFVFFVSYINCMVCVCVSVTLLKQLHTFVCCGICRSRKARRFESTTPSDPVAWGVGLKKKKPLPSPFIDGEPVRDSGRARRVIQANAETRTTHTTPSITT